MKPVALFVCAALLCSLHSVWGLTITVNSINGTELNRLVDENAAFQDRAYQLPGKATSIKGVLTYPGGDVNPCVHVPTLDTNLSVVIAFVDSHIYDSCPFSVESNVYNAHYSAMLAVTKYKTGFLNPQTPLPQALIADSYFAHYLKENVVVNDSTTNYTSYVQIWDDSLAKLERLFIIFGSILMAAVFLAIAIFCCSFCCRAVIYKWRTRGLTQWQVRQLPRRRYRGSRETSETCSICLDDFKEGETIRVLPCDHVFHPKCVDEWLQKWNRTCPLCKSTIKRRGGGRTNVRPDETTSLLPSEDGNTSTRVSLNEETPPTNYGATGPDPLPRSADNLTVEGDPSLRASPFSDREFHTPIQNTSEDERATPSFQTANDELSVRVQ